MKRFSVAYTSIRPQKKQSTHAKKGFAAQNEKLTQNDKAAYQTMMFNNTSRNVVGNIRESINYIPTTMESQESFFNEDDQITRTQSIKY